MDILFNDDIKSMGSGVSELVNKFENYVQYDTVGLSERKSNIGHSKW
jgi:hypothetical protein